MLGGNRVSSRMFWQIIHFQSDQERMQKDKRAEIRRRLAEYKILLRMERRLIEYDGFVLRQGASIHANNYLHKTWAKGKRLCPIHAIFQIKKRFQVANYTKTL